MKYIVTAYAMDHSLPLVTEADCRMLTHLNVAFGLVKDHRIQIGQLKHTECLQQIRNWNPDLKILLSIGGWGAGGFSEAAFTDEGRRLFADTACDAVRTLGLDGIDIDWEYPTYGEAEIGCAKEDKQNYTLLLKAIREALDRMGGPRRLLTTAVGADQYFVDGTGMHEAQKYLDVVQLMTYDMRGGFQILTWHHTNLYNSTGDLFRISTDSSVRMYVAAGVPREKIVIGAAFYGRMWKNVPNRNNGLFQMAPGTGGYGAHYDEVEPRLIAQEGYVRYWDDEAKAPYLFNGTNFMSYDDEESIAAKCEYLKTEGLAGIMYWEHSGDKTRRLLSTMHRKLNG